MAGMLAVEFRLQTGIFEVFDLQDNFFQFYVDLKWLVFQACFRLYGWRRLVLYLISNCRSGSRLQNQELWRLRGRLRQQSDRAALWADFSVAKLRPARPRLNFQGDLFVILPR